MLKKPELPSGRRAGSQGEWGYESQDNFKRAEIMRNATYPQITEKMYPLNVASGMWLLVEFHPYYHTIALISHTSKVMLKILQARLQQYMNCELPDVQAGFRKGRGTRDQMLTSAGSWKKQESSRKISISAFLTMPKPLTV